MKLRIRRNSIRLRLTISEVEWVAAGEAVSATLETAPMKFTYELKAGQVDNVTVSFNEDRLAVSIPFEDAKDLARTERVGIRSSGGPATLVVIEKDFGCAKPRPGEDQGDLYGFAAAL